MSVRHGERLLGHLVERRGEFLLQGEVYCTIGLGWVLRAEPARTRFGRLLGLSKTHLWQAEIEVVEDVRVDLIGQSGEPGQLESVCIVEGKIHHEISAKQLLDYAGWLEGENIGERVLGLLVPVSRQDDAKRVLESFEPPRNVRLELITWEACFAALEGAGLPQDITCDLTQLQDLYHQYDASWISPFLPDETTTIGWTARRGDVEKLIDQVTARLQRSALGRQIPRLLPLPARASEGYFRFLDLNLDVVTSVAVGLFHDLDGFPFALRYRPQDVPDFAGVQERLINSGNAEVKPNGVIYLRLRIADSISQQGMLHDLGRQIEEVLRCGHPELPSSDPSVSGPP